MIRTFDAFCIENNCTEDEKKSLRAMLFAIRAKDIDLNMLEKIMKKYADIL